jgi:hypothetical protein
VVVEVEQIMVVVVEQVDFELAHQFQFVEQQVIQLRLEQEEQELLMIEVVQVVLQYFQQKHQQVVVEVVHKMINLAEIVQENQVVQEAEQVLKIPDQGQQQEQEIVHQ